MLKLCCGCVDMQRGVILIGVFGLMVSLLSMSIQFVAIAERNEIMLNKEDPVSTNLFSFIFSMGILVSFFKLTSDLLVIYGAKNQTTKEVSVWLIINLCSVLYSFVSMVFIYILFVEHDTKFDQKDVLFIELVLGIINVLYIYLWYQVYLFSRQLYLDGRTSLEGIIQSGIVAA